MEITDLTKHDGAMLLLDRMVEADENHFVSELIVRADGLFDDEDSVPAYLGLEYMAQTVAAFSGYQSARRSEGARPGFLLGTRRFNTNVSCFPCGTKLLVSAVRQVQGASGLAAFDCRIVGDGIEQTATLSVYEPPDANSYVQGESR